MSSDVEEALSAEDQQSYNELSAKCTKSEDELRMNTSGSVNTLKVENTLK